MCDSVICILKNNVFLFTFMISFNKMGPDTYFELTKRSIPIIKNEAAHLSWRNTILSIRTIKHVNFLEFSYNLECLEKNIDFVECQVPSPKDSPATELCKCDFLKSEMRNLDYTNMIVNPSYWPHNPSLTQEMASVSMCKWSPTNAVKSESVLAILNNIGGVEIFGQQQLQLKSILNLSPYIKDAVEYNKNPKNFEELKESVCIVETSAICWAQELNADESCYFITAQKNGIILIWQISSNISTAKLQGRIETNMAEILRIKWVAKSENKFILICADVLGQVCAYESQIINETVHLLQRYTLWPCNDRMTTVSLNYTIIDNHLIFVCSKHRHLLVQAINENGTIVAQYLNNINDHRITDIVHTKEGMYVATVNVKIYKINITFQNGNLNVNLEQLDIKDPYPTHELYSLRFSNNNVVCALAMADRRVLWRKEAHKMEIIFLSTESKLDSIIPTLLNNPARALTCHWDCVEVLRFQMTKLKVIPKLDYNELYTEALRDAYKLKIYYILMTYFSSLKKLLRNCTSVNLPETSPVIVKENILYLYAHDLISTLYNKCQEEGQLCDSDMESLYGSKNYLEFFSTKYKIEIDFDKNVLNALEHSCEYVCQCCDEKIDGFSCKYGHLNMFCMETFTPITCIDYLLCRCCGFTARADLNYKPLCVFCDLPLVKPD